jgi:hypothetical protein
LLALAFFITFALISPYLAVANAEPALTIPILYQLASGFQSISYPLGILLVVAISVQTVRARGFRTQPPPAS